MTKRDIRTAQLGSAAAAARLSVMKLRAELDPPRATTEKMPFAGHRTCAEWEERNGVIVERQMTQAERRRDATQGSRKLKEAIKRAAA